MDNNALSLPKGMVDYGRSASSLATAMLNEGKSPQENCWGCVHLLPRCNLQSIGYSI
ncbi:MULTISPECIES: hypothetical protein [Photorhabdus]|uniref:hypothetical protein n=1 Tax=Photorhabdus TaxID=29487 RepID=UPI0002F54926|nr:hypothetical protein [Photorhabdus asymbiotica]